MHHFDADICEVHSYLSFTTLCATPGMELLGSYVERSDITFAPNLYNLST